MNFDELKNKYMWSYKKYSAEDIHRLILINYLQEAQHNPVIIEPAKNKSSLIDDITFLQLKSKQKKKCKFLKCYCKLKNNILKLNRDKNCLT